MERIQLHDQSPEFSRLALGTWKLLENPAMKTPEGILSLLKAAIDAGVTTIDTAEIYGLYTVEEALGRAFALDEGVKSKLEIVTKAGIYVPCDFHPDRKIAFYNATAERLVKSAEKSLKFLGVEVLDLFLVHRPDWLTPYEETAKGLEQLVDTGKVKEVGVSNYTPWQFDALQTLCSVPLATNQVEFNFFHVDPMFDGTFDVCQAFGCVPMAWSPTGRGKVFGDDPAAVRIRAAMAEMAPRYGNAGVDQLTHAWVLAHPAKPMSVLGTTKPDRIQSAAKATDIKLSREDWYALTQAARGAKVP